MSKGNHTNNHILILWGNTSLRNSLGTFMRMHGYLVAHTGDPFQALNILEKEELDPYDLVILGDDLSALVPQELVLLIRSQYSKEKLPLLLLAPSAPVEELKDILGSGVNSVVIGKINNQNIYKKAKALLDKSTRS